MSFETRYGAPMKFYSACATWIGIGCVLGYSIIKFSTTGNPILLLLCVVSLIVAVGKIGCATH